MALEDQFLSGVAKMCSHTFQLMREHRSPSERMTSEPRLGLLARFELDRSGAQSEASRKIGVFGFLNQMVQFWQIQPSPVTRIDDGNKANLHPSGVWVREGKDRG
jgi:hypothetical protein